MTPEDKSLRIKGKLVKEGSVGRHFLKVFAISFWCLVTVVRPQPLLGVLVVPLISLRFPPAA